jgi:asparagine synthase (glutamine-hydrolysing)
MLQNCRLTAHPILNFSAFDTDRPTALLARKANATAVTDGELGDELFGCAMGVEALAEYWRCRGLTREFLRYANQFALMRRISVWNVMQSIFQLLATRARPEAETRAINTRKRNFPKQALVTSEILHDYELNNTRFLHPWLQENGIPASKLTLISALIGVSSRLATSPFRENGPPRVSPLVCQPLIELCLRIESQLSFHGARNRAVVRNAFSDALPTEITERVGKSSHTKWLRAVVFYNRSFIREFLMDGILVARNILCRRQIEAALVDVPSNTPISPNDLIAKVYMESWARQWRIRQARN